VLTHHRRGHVGHPGKWRNDCSPELTDIIDCLAAVASDAAHHVRESA